MADYKAMYYHLAGRMATALDALGSVKSFSQIGLQTLW